MLMVDCNDAVKVIFENGKDSRRSRLGALGK
jgi:hypothetical protein